MMEEYYDRDPVVNRGITVDGARVQLLAFRLLTIFLASENLHKLCDGEYNSGPDILANQFEKDEIEHLMLLIATLWRSHDTCAGRGVTFHERWNPVVGTLQEPIDAEGKDLDLREACSKIIHVEEIKYDLAGGDPDNPYDWKRFLLPTHVSLYGKRQTGKQWKATVDVKKFCSEVCYIE